MGCCYLCLGTGKPGAPGCKSQQTVDISRGHLLLWEALWVGSDGQPDWRHSTTSKENGEPHATEDGTQPTVWIPCLVE